MALSTYLLYLAAVALLVLSPGPTMLMCVTNALNHGPRAALTSASGSVTAALAVLLLSVLGLGALLAASEVAFTVLKTIGAAYLVWLGIQQWRAPAHGLADADGSAKNTTPPTRGQLVLRGFLINASNPKGLVFMLAVLPQFINPAAPQLPQYLLCGLSLFITDIVVMNAYTLLAARVLVALRSRQHQLWLQRSFGTLFIGAALLLSAFRRSN